MRMPFGKLMELVAALDRKDGVTFGELSRRWGEDPHRVMRGERTYITWAENPSS
jgi:hypothetical protein